MLPRTLAAATLFFGAAAAPPPPPFAPCCAYNAPGAAVLLGTGVLDAFAPARGAPGGLPTGPAALAPMALGASPFSEPPFSAVLMNATSPEDAAAGWIVTSNATNDLLYVFSRVGAAGPVCAAGVAPRGAMVGSLKVCAGAGGVFPAFERAFAVGGARAGVFSQAPGPTQATFLEGACQPLAVAGASSPFGTGAWSLQVESGEGAAPPASWGVPPTWCTEWAEVGAGGW